MSDYHNRVKNLIRVVKAVPDEKFDITCWCDCAIGHAMRDAYFVEQKFKPSITNYTSMAEFFDITIDRVRNLFVRRSGYGSRTDVLTALRVLSLEKSAQDMNMDILSTKVDTELELV